MARGEENFAKPVQLIWPAMFYPFGSSSLFLPAKPKIWPAIWPLTGHYFEP